MMCNIKKMKKYIDLLRFWKKRNTSENLPSTYWAIDKYRDKKTGMITDDWRMERLCYRSYNAGDNPSCIKLYADGELVFEGRYGELVNVIREYNKLKIN